MSKNIKLKRGFNINLKGEAQKVLTDNVIPTTYAVKPSDFPGFQRAKVLVEVGQNVKAGTPLFLDKKFDSIMFTAPVSGEVVDVKRGEKRKVLEVTVLADKEIEYENFNSYSVSEIHNQSKADVVNNLLKSGVWPNILQRPFGIIANPADTPSAIHISGFDSHPLAPDYGFIFNGEERYFQAGVDLLKKFTEGPVHLNLNGTGEMAQVFAQIEGVQVNKVSGPHPAGNVGVQIHHISPVNKGDVVWTVNPLGVIQIGKLFLEGKYDTSRVFALTGSEVANPGYYKTYTGANVGKFLENNLNGDHYRVISGNVLTGERISRDGFIGYYDHQVTVIPEGDHYEMFGWILPSSEKLSFHRGLGLFSFLNRKKQHVVDTNLHGEPRAFVTTGSFEQVTPMDIYPTYLLKAILAEDFDDMEALGIYEVIPEDLALCEFIDVSKHEVQDIVRDGIDLMLNS